MEVKLKPCEYCGNKSHKIDKRGNCKGCGAPREEQETKVFPRISNEVQFPSYNHLSSNSSTNMFWATT